MDTLPLVLVAVLGISAGLALGLLIGARTLRRDHALADQLGVAASATSRAVEPVKESLDRFDARLRSLETSRIQWHAQLREQVEAVRQTSELLRQETSSLAGALRRPAVRGRWGEMHLKRAVEIAGLVEHSDFEQQPTVSVADVVQRPDLVVHLAGGKQVIVDSKVPLDAFLDAAQSDDADRQRAFIADHARQLRTHVDVLAGKAYWRQFDRSPEFVVLFMPGEAFLSHALDAEPSLLEYAAQRRVVLATPTTLIALLRTVAYAWTQDRLTDNARELHAQARELYERLGTLGTHVDRLGRSLTAAVGSYNKAVASLETRVLVSARRITEFDIGAADLDTPRGVEEAVRPLTAAELLGADDTGQGETGDGAARRIG